MRHINPKLLIRLEVNIASLEQTLAWYAGATYTGHSIRRHKGEWLIVLRATFKGEAMVTFVRGETPYDAWYNLGLFLKKSQLDWTQDKFAN